MKCDGFELLYKVVRIAHCAVHDQPQAFKDILQLLERSFLLDGITLLLLDSGGRYFVQSIDAGGAQLFRPCRQEVAGSPPGQALISRQPWRQTDALYLPVSCCSQDFGVLVLILADDAELSEEDQRTLGLVAEELATLARNVAIQAEDRWRMEQLAFLSDLGRQLTHAQQFKELLTTAAKSIHRHSQAACVILRPLLGGTVMGSSSLRIDSPYRKYRPRLEQLEEEYGQRSLRQAEPLYFDDLPADSGGEPLPLRMVIMPLRFLQRPLGTLTLFFDREPAELPLASKHASREFYHSVGSLLGHALERVATLERLETLSAENDLKFQELSLLYRTFRAIHSTLNLNELMHLILSTATISAGGGFERAMLFTINERSGALQGMLGVDRDGAALVFPPHDERGAWEHPGVSPEIREIQRQMSFSQKVMRQRLNLDADDNALARAVLKGRVIFVSQPGVESEAGRALAVELQLGPYACAPLRTKERPLGVLVVDSCESGQPIGLDRLRFLELFAHQASAAIDNSMLMQRLETVNRELREAQERLIQGEKMAALGELAASIAHELKTPLVPIGGFAKRLGQRVEPGSKEAEYCEIIQRETRRMEQILSEILGFSRKQMLCYSECRIERIIEQALVLEDDALRGSGIQVHLNYDCALPPFQGDDQKLLQVLMNLIDNARHAMGEGGELRIRAGLGPLRDEPAVVIQIQDSGGGIPPDVLKEIFTPFYTTKKQGTGLGLAISQRILQQHRGIIEAHNEDGGAIFTLRLPLGPGVEAFH